jgi:RNA polymerase sigma-70 factor (ECF subfamily)
VDDASFVRLVPPHAAAVLRVATALVGHGDAEDAAQEAMARAWKAWGTLRDAGATRSWLLRITVNVCREWHRGAFGTHRRSTTPFPDDATPAALTEMDAGTSDHTGALDLRAAIRALPDEQRLAVVLRFYGGMEPSEIAAALGIPPATVRTRLHRALAALRKRLDCAPGPSHPTNVPSTPEGGR